MVRQVAELKQKRLTLLAFLCKSLLWEDNLPNIIFYILFLASNIQMFAILVWGQLKLIATIDEDGVSYGLRKLANILATREIVDSDISQAGQLIVLVVFILYMVLFLIALGLVIKNHIKGTNLSRLESFYLTIIGQFHLSLGFWIVNSITMYFVAHYLISEEGLTLGTMEMTIIILSGILIGFNYLFGFFYAVFSYDPFISSNAFASHSCLYQVFTFFYQAILSPLLAFLDNTNSAAWALVVLSLVILGLRHISLIRSFQFYHYWPMKASLIFSAICVTISIVNLVASFSKSSLLFTAKIVYLEAWLVPLAIKLTSTQFFSIILSYQSIANKDLKSKEQVFKKILALKYATKNPQFTINNEARRNLGEIRFWGILGQNEKKKGFGSVSNLNHILKSSSTNLNLDKQDFDAGDVSKHYSELITLMNRKVLQESTENFKHNQQMKIIFAHLALTYSQVPSAYIIHQAGFDKISGMTGITAIRFKEKLNTSITEFFSRNKGKVLDLQSYIKLEELSDVFSQMIQKNSKKTIEFWQSYAESQVSVKNLNLKSRVLEKEADDIAYFWRRCAVNQRGFTKQIGSLYSMYLSVIRNTPYLAHKILQSYSTSDIYHHYVNADNDDPLSEDTLLSSNILAFYVSLPKDRQPKITYVTSSLTENLGWNQNEVLGHNINMVMPNFMKEQHDQIIARHSKGQTDGTEKSKMYKNLESFVLEKSGNILPCDVYISIHPHIQTIPIYIALVKPKKTLGDQLILNDEGVIEGFTKNVGKNFGLTFNGRMNIKSICKDYSELSHAMQNVNSMHRIETKEHFDTTSRRSRSDAPTIRSIKSAFGNPKQNRLSMKASVPNTTFTMEFLTYNTEDPKIKTKEPVLYTVRLSSQKFGELYYYVLNLEQQIVRIEDERFFNNEPQKSYLDHPSFMNPDEFSEMMLDICDERTVPEQDTASALPALPIFGSASTRYAKNDMQKKAIMNAQISEFRNLKSMVPQPSEPLRSVSIMLNSQNRDFENYMSTVTQNRELIRGGDGYYPLESKDFVPKPTTITNRNGNDEGGDDISWINRSSSLQKNKDPTKAFGRLKSQDHENWEVPVEEKKDDALKIIELGHQAASSVGTSFKAEMVKLEQAVVLVPKNVNLGILHLVVLLFIVVLTAPLVVFAIQSQTVINLVQSSVEVISMSIFRLVRITDMTQYVRMYFLAQLGMLAPNRYAYLGYTDTVEDISAAQLLDVCSDLNNRNNQLRDFVYKLDSQLQEKIYQDEININELNDEGVVVADRKGNTFDIITELVSQSINLVSSGVPANYQNYYLMYIFNNTYNDLLITSAQTVPILIEDNQTKLQAQVDYIIYSMSVLAVASFFVLWFFYKITRNFIKDRNQFISILFALEREAIEKHLMIMNKFVTLIDKSKIDGKKVNLASSIDTFLNYSTYKLKDDKFKKKSSANVGGINKILILLNFSMIALVVMMYSSYIALLVFMTNGNQGILAKVDLLSQSNLNLYKLNSLATSIYEYIQENITTQITNIPIKEFYEDTYKEATKAQDFILYDLLDTTNGVGNNAVLVEIATGDLCSNIDAPDENLARLCPIMGGGVALSGLIGLNSFTLASMKAVKDYFDYSNRTIETEVAALAMEPLVDIEIFYPFTYVTYKYIDNLLKTQLASDFGTFKHQIVEIVIAYVVLYYLVGIYLWVKIKRTFEVEMASWRKMLRQIPQGLVATNKRLRRYLAQNSNGILSARS